jgi:flagellar hook-basal body complex protein FliE
MTIEAIAAIGTVSSTEVAMPATIVRSDFSVALGGGIQAVDSALKTADQQVRTLASGQEISPHDVMISLEEARMHLMLLSEVRNRVVEAYQELSRMQV